MHTTFFVFVETFVTETASCDTKQGIAEAFEDLGRLRRSQYLSEL